MTSPFWAAAFLWWWRIIPAACAGTGLAWGIRWWIRQWRDASSLIAETAAMGDAPAGAGIDAVALAVTCRWCAAKPTGRCICGVWCGHQQCPRLSRAELDYLDRGTEMPR